MADPYSIERDSVPCPKCGEGGMWIVVGPDGFGSATSYGDEEDAQDICDMLNIAYQRGIQDGERR